MFELGEGKYREENKVENNDGSKTSFSSHVWTLRRNKEGKVILCIVKLPFYP